MLKKGYSQPISPAALVRNSGSAARKWCQSPFFIRQGKGRAIFSGDFCRNVLQRLGLKTTMPSPFRFLDRSA